MIAYRSALAADFPHIRELVLAARINPTALHWQRFWVAFPVDETNQPASGKTVIACGQIKAHRDGSHELASLVVEPAYRGRGIATALIAHLTRHYAGDLHLMCRASLGGFYEKLGFSVIAEPAIPPYFRRITRLATLIEALRQQGQTLLVMRKTFGARSKLPFELPG